MATPRPKPKPDSKDRRSGVSPGDASQRFVEALQDFVQELYNGQNNAHQQAMDAQQKLVEKIKVDLEGTQKRYEDVNRSYAGKMQETWGPAGDQIVGARALQDYHQELQGLHPEVQQSYESAYRQYFEGLKGLWENTHIHNKKACEKYFKAVEKEWSAMDLSAMDFNTMMSISQIILAGYLCAGANTLPSL